MLGSARARDFMEMAARARLESARLVAISADNLSLMICRVYCTAPFPVDFVVVERVKAGLRTN